MNLKLTAVALLISIVLGWGLWQREQAHILIRQLNYKTTQLSDTQTKLKQTQILLAVAENKLGFLERCKLPVQVTAYTIASSSVRFADGGDAERAYAVPRRTLPQNKVVMVALSPVVQARLHAKMHDYIVLIQKQNHRRTVARFVDTMPGESRPVVDVFFADTQQALLWGRRTDYYAVNISSANSPFRGIR